MAAPTLNRARPFGAISGDALGRMYEQDNLFFMADGSAWIAPEVDWQVNPDAAPESVTAPDAAPDDAPAAKKAPAKKKSKTA